MIFAVICNDKPGAVDVRNANREAHLAYAAQTGAVRRGGPLLDDDGAMVGSLLFIEAADRAAAGAWAANDPYARAGLFESVQIRAWKQTIGE
ncbi:MAG: YciI family protein [Paracoccaceae bacterium]